MFTLCRYEMKTAWNDTVLHVRSHWNVLITGMNWKQPGIKSYRFRDRFHFMPVMKIFQCKRARKTGSFHAVFISYRHSVNIALKNGQYKLRPKMCAIF